jgi:hypothetical protein
MSSNTEHIQSLDLTIVEDGDSGQVDTNVVGETEAFADEIRKVNEINSTDIDLGLDASVVLHAATLAKALENKGKLAKTYKKPASWAKFTESQKKGFAKAWLTLPGMFHSSYMRNNIN